MDSAEQRIRDLELAVGRLETQQEQTREVLRSRFDALFKAQELIAMKVDGFKDMVTLLASDAEQTPAGRALGLVVKTTADQVKGHVLQLADLLAFQNEVRGAMRLVKWLGFSSVLAALASLLKSFGVAWLS